MVNQTPMFGNPVSSPAVRRSKYLEDAITGMQQGRDKNVYNTAFGTNASILADAILAFSKRDADNKADAAIKADNDRLTAAIMGTPMDTAKADLAADKPFDLTPAGMTGRVEDTNAARLKAIAEIGGPMAALQYQQGQEQQNYMRGRDTMEDKRWDAQFGFQKDRAAVGDEQWNQQFDFTKDRAATQDDQWGQQFDFTKDRAETQDQQWDQQFNEGKRQFDETMKFNNFKLALDDAAASGLNPDVIKLEREFAKDWKGVQSNFQDVNNQFGRMEEMYSLAQQDPSKAGAADLALVVSFTKMLDPGSVAREGEVALTQKAASVLDQAGNWLNQLQNGQTILPADARKQLMEAAREMYGVYDKAYQRIGADYYSTATEYGFSPDRVMMGYSRPEDAILGGRGQFNPAAFQGLAQPGAAPQTQAPDDDIDSLVDRWTR